MAQTIDRPLLASEFFAYAHELRCEGMYSCHFCSAPCSNRFINEQMPSPLIERGIRTRSIARRPGSPYYCQGCWLWRRRRVTVNHLCGDYKDGQAACKQSWLILPNRGAFVLNHSTPPWQTCRAEIGCKDKLWEFLLKPDKRFCLAFYDGEDNHLQLMEANDLIGVTIETPLRFTINNVIHSYSVYDLEQSMKLRQATSPGVGGLTRMLGDLPEAPAREVKKGRPKGKQEELDSRQMQRVVRVSG